VNNIIQILRRLCLPVAIDVLDLDSGVVNQDADRQR
jgi:hypothetical protein